MNLYLLWTLFCIFLTKSTPAKTDNDFKLSGKVVKKVEIGFDFIEGNALITYDDLRRTKGKISYSEKKKVVAYRDEEIGLCLLEKITKHKQARNGDEKPPLGVYHIAEPFLEKAKAEKLAGKKLVSFCSKFPITLLKEYSVESNQNSEKLSKSNGRVRRDSDFNRGKKNQLSYQEISKNLLEDMTNSDVRINSSRFSGKGVKRNVEDRTGHGIEHHPSASAKSGQPATVDYHARIRNDLPPGAHNLHPIDITSSVTIATGPSHPVWSYPPSADSHFPPNGTGNGQGISSYHGDLQHATFLHSPQQNASRIHHHGHHHSPGLNSQTHYQNVETHPSSSGHSLKTSSYYPPSSTSQSQPSMAHYPPSSIRTQSHSPHYPPSMFSQPQQNNAYYPPSSTSKTQHLPSHFPPSSTSKSQPGSPYFPPSSSSKSHQNESSAGHGVHPSLTGKTPVISHYPPNSYSIPHGYHQGYVPPSSTSKIHYSAQQPQNTSHSSFHRGGTEPGRDAYAPQFPPSSTSKIYHQQGQYGTDGRSAVAQYPPSSTSKLHHAIPGSGHGGRQDHFHGNAQYPPSSSSKEFQPASHYAPKFPVSSDSKQSYSPSARDSLYVQTPVLERPSTGRNTYNPGTHPPSSPSKVHYSPHGHVIPAGGNTQEAQYYPPSSSSKVSHSPSSSDQDHHTPLPYPPSSTSKVHFPHSSGSDTPAQIPQPPTNRNLGFPPSSTSKIHPTPSHQPQNYPPPSIKEPQAVYIPDRSQHHQSPAYYPPSSTSKVHQTHQNGSSTKQPTSPGYYPSSSASNLHHSPAHHTGGRITATGRVSVTPGFAYYPPISSSKSGVLDWAGQHAPSGHPFQHYPYYGPMSSAHQHNDSLSHGSSGIPQSFTGHGLYSPSYYPPSSFSKIHPSQQPNGSTPDFSTHSKPLYPVEQHPSSSGQQSPPHHNDSSSGQFHLPQGGYYPSNNHHPLAAGGLVPHFPPSSSHDPQQPHGGRQPQIHQISPHSGQGSQAPVRPCQSPPRSLYSITTRTILTPNGAVQRPVSLKTDGENPCGGAGQVPGAFPYARYAPCSGTLTRNGPNTRSQTPCLGNGNLRKSMRSVVPGPAFLPERGASQQSENGYIRTGKEPHHRGYGHSGGAVATNIEAHTELLNGQRQYHRSQFSKLQAAENSTSEIATGPEFFEENGRNGKDVEVFERNEEEDEKSRTFGKPVKYQEKEEETKTEVTSIDSGEEVKEGDVLEPGDRILGKDGYTILEGFRGRVISVTGQVAKTRTEAGKEARGSESQEPEKKSNSGQFKYSSDLGRYVKENGEKTYSNCHGEPTFTCSEFLGSNGRAKICKPNPRRNPDGSPC